MLLKICVTSVKAGVLSHVSQVLCDNMTRINLHFILALGCTFLRRIFFVFAGLLAILSLWFAAFLKIEPSKYYCFGKSKPRGEWERERARPLVVAYYCVPKGRAVCGSTKHTTYFPRSEAEMTSAEASEATFPNLLSNLTWHDLLVDFLTFRKL